MREEVEKWKKVSDGAETDEEEGEESEWNY